MAGWSYAGQYNGQLARILSCHDGRGIVLVRHMLRGMLRPEVATRRRRGRLVVEDMRIGAREQRARVTTWIRLARFYHRLDRASAELLRGWDLSVAQFDVLAQIGAREGLSQQELANRLLVTKGNISQLLVRMVRRGLVRRSQEGRMMALFLTDEGRALHARVVPAQEAMVARHFAGLVPAEVRALSATLRALNGGTAE